MQISEDILKSAKEARLRYIQDSLPGFKRVKAGKGFKFVDVHGSTIKNPEILNRIKNLRIPPAWDNVWISPSDNTHLQATGLDDRGRKQYIYNQKWIDICQENKFSKMIPFAENLPKIRSKVKKDMMGSELLRKKVLATIIWLLEHTFIRIGNKEYAKDNNSFGLTTLRNRHVAIRGINVRFEFKGKSGVDHTVDISHPVVSKTLKKCIELPGFQLFQCIDEEGKKHIIDSEDVNEYLHGITGDDTSAKDFRTWGGTVLSAITLNGLGSYDNDQTLKQNLVQTIKTVSNHLRNTPTVCRKYYIHPTVIKTYQSNILISHFSSKLNKKSNGLGLNEYRVLTLLEKYS